MVSLPPHPGFGPKPDPSDPQPDVKKHPEHIQKLLDSIKETFPNMNVEGIDVTEAFGKALEHAEDKPWVLVRSDRSGTWIGRQCCRSDYYAGFGVHLIDARQVLSSLRYDDVAWLASTGQLSSGLKLGVVTQIELIGVYEFQPLTPEALKNLRALPEWK